MWLYTCGERNRGVPKTTPALHSHHCTVTHPAARTTWLARLSGGRASHAGAGLLEEQLAKVLAVVLGAPAHPAGHALALAFGRRRRRLRRRLRRLSSGGVVPSLLVGLLHGLPHRLRQVFSGTQPVTACPGGPLGPLPRLGPLPVIMPRRPLGPLPRSGPLPVVLPVPRPGLGRPGYGPLGATIGPLGRLPTFLGPLPMSLGALPIFLAGVPRLVHAASAHGRPGVGRVGLGAGRAEGRGPGEATDGGAGESC